MTTLPDAGGVDGVDMCVDTEIADDTQSNRTLSVRSRGGDPRTRKRREQAVEKPEKPHDCHVCEEPGAGKVFHGFFTHMGCHAALRCRHRQIKQGGGQTAIDEELRFMREEPAEWRLEVKPLLEPDTRGTARAAARSKAKRFQDQCDVNSRKKVKDKLTLTKRRYKHYCWLWDGIQSDEASSDFEKILVEQNGTDTIDIDDIPRMRTETGTENRTGTRTYIEDGSDNHGGRSRSPPPVPRMSGASAPGAGDPTPITKSRAHRFGHAQPTFARSGSGPLSVVCAEKEYDSVAFMRKKDDFKNGLQALLQEITGTKGSKAALNLMEKELSAKNAGTADLPYTTSELLTKIQSMTDQLKALISDAAAMEKDGVDAVGAKIEVARSQVVELNKVIDEQLAAGNWKLAQARNGIRSNYHSKRWQNQKMTQKLVSGGYMPKHAQFVSEAIMREEAQPADTTADSDGVVFVKTKPQLDPSVGEFNNGQVALFSKKDVPLVKAFFDTADANKDVLSTKWTSLLAALDANPKWPGSFGVVSSGLIPEAFGSETLAQADTAGGKPWLLAVKKYAKRFGPSAVALPGAPCLYFALDQPVYVSASPVALVLEMGIALHDFDRFCSTDGGREFLKAKSVFLKITPGTCCFVPAGWVCHLLYADNKATPKKVTIEATGVLVYVLFIGAWFSALPDNVRRALHAWNKEQFEFRHESGMWKDRASAFNDVFTV